MLSTATVVEVYRTAFDSCTFRVPTGYAFNVNQDVGPKPGIRRSDGTYPVLSRNTDLSQVAVLTPREKWGVATCRTTDGDASNWATASDIPDFINLGAYFGKKK